MRALRVNAIYFKNPSKTYLCFYIANCTGNRLIAYAEYNCHMLELITKASNLILVTRNKINVTVI